MKEKILIAAVGGLAGDESAAMLVEGYVVALAATDRARQAIEAGEESLLGRWLEDQITAPPGAGGLWVLECQLRSDDDDDDEEWPEIVHPRWRAPTVEELAALRLRQKVRARRSRPDPRALEGLPERWVYLGALV